MENDKDKWKLEEDTLTPEKTDNVITQKGPSIQSSEYTVEEIITGQLNKNLVVFAGPRGSGKTVALMRLTHYLKKNRNTKIEPNRTYRSDSEYQNSVKRFLNDLHRPDFSPQRTGEIDFLVLDVFKDGEVYCQFLEAPGEAFFNNEDPYNISFPTYLTEILLNDKLNKIFIFFFEEGMLSKSDSMAYSSRLSSLVSKMNKKKDDVIILYNKADKLRELYTNNKPNAKEFKRRLYENTYYADFLGSLQTLGIPVKFVPFSSGVFQKVQGKPLERWMHSEDHYPETLWRNIDRCFKSWLPW